jgi:hypothetical protein
MMAESSLPFDPRAYGPAVAELLLPRRECSLGQGTPNRAVELRIRKLTPETLLAGREVVDHDMAQACLAGLWLYHDFLEESHAISQEIHTPSGSFWHGILHRREGDYDNAKYWFRRVGNHPVYTPLRQFAAEAAAGESDADTRFLLKQAAWDPFRFVDLCQASTARNAGAELCESIQTREWELLFDYCYRAAGSPSCS